MDTEGIGKAPPAKIRVRLSKEELVILLREAERRAKHRSYKHGRGVWKNGMLSHELILGIGSVSRDVMPIFVGLIGEWSAAKFINSRIGQELAVVDFSLNANGDGGIDLKAAGLSIQVKTKRSSTENLVRRIKRKRIQSLEADVFLFCRFVGQSACDLDGWIWADDVQRLGQISQSPIAGADHWNLIISPSDLQPMCSLIREIESRLP